MNAIQTHNFNDAKNKLKSFSNEVPSSIDLNTVETDGGLFGWFSHKVTGDELNELTAQIQQHLITITSCQSKTIKEFDEIYKAFEALDKDYIAGIIAAVKAAEKASEQAKESAAKAEANSRDIKVIIEAQKRTINSLVQFQEKIQKYEHLKNIDEIWGNYTKTEEEIKSIKRLIDNQNKNITKTGIDIGELNNSVKRQITQVNSNIDKLESSVKKQTIQTNDKVDKIETSIKEYAMQTGDSISKVEDLFKNQIEQTNEIISTLESSVMAKITQASDAIGEIESVIKEQTVLANSKADKIEAIVEERTTQANDKIIELRGIVDEQTTQINEYKSYLDENRIIHEKQINHLSDKIKLSYILAGSTAGIALLSVILNILGVL